ncbi:MAG: helix-turn-helix domain-containing protein [Bacteroidota bacterium]
MENIYFVAAILGGLLSVALLSQIFTPKKGSFFLGLVILLFSFELLLSWGALSGYNNTPGAIPFGFFLNYLLIPPSIWLFVKYNTDHNFRFQPWHFSLFIPVLLEIGLSLFARITATNLREYALWIFLVDYLPLLGFIAVLAYFWRTYFGLRRQNAFKAKSKQPIPQIRLLVLMSALTLICLCWIVFSFVGWAYFEIIELTLVLLIFGFAFLNFLDGQQFPAVVQTEPGGDFPNYDDPTQLRRLERALKEEALFLNSNLSLKELANALDLPVRYVSYLINRYHHKNYKEFVNGFRVEAFLAKAKSGEQEHKTLLALALESGFSSKSTFNQVFKNHTGQSPSAYLKQGD